MALVKLNNKGVSNATAFGSITALGSMIFIKKLTASGSATLSFVDGASGVVLDNTYKEYVFTFNNIHPASSGNYKFQFNVSIDGGSNYNVAKTSTFYVAYHKEDNAEAVLTYDTGYDLAQGTGFQPITSGVGGAVADENACGTLQIFNPSSTTFVKHYICSSNSYRGDFVGSFFQNIAGYANTTSAVNAVQFNMSTGNIDAGDICLYGIA